MTERKKILLVEDDDSLRNTFKGRLLAQYTIFEAQNGEQAVSECLDRLPDLILLDLLLPKLDGFKVLERIRRYPDPIVARTPVIVLSNLWSQKDILQAQGLKIDEYFVKAHTSIEEVISRIHREFSPLANSGKLDMVCNYSPFPKAL